jgi:hypothetical protein
MLKGIQAAMRPATAPVVRAAVKPAFTSGTTTSVTFGLTGLTTGATYRVGLFGPGKTGPQLTGLTASGTGFTGTDETDLTLVAGGATASGLTITTGVLSSDGEYTVRVRLSTVATYPSSGRLTVYYDKTFSAGWLRVKPKVTTVTGNQVVTGGFNVVGSLLRNGVAVGGTTGSGGSTTVAVGANAGASGQGSNAVAVGANAGQNNQATGSIVINATGSVLNNTAPNTCVIKPIRTISGGSLPSGFTLLYWNQSTGEVLTYDPSPA